MRLDPEEVRALLSRLCIRYGFCLPPADMERLGGDPPTKVDQLTEAALVAAGYGFSKSDPLCAAAMEMVAQAFFDHLSKNGQ